jgi:hypothetical protein
MGLRPGFSHLVKNSCSVLYSSTGFSAASVTISNVCEECRQAHRGGEFASPRSDGRCIGWASQHKTPVKLVVDTPCYALHMALPQAMKARLLTVLNTYLLTPVHTMLAVT